MDDDIKSRFDETDKRYATLEKRFDDIKWYFSGVASLFTVGFSVLVLILSWNYGSERASLREFQKDLKAELGKLESPPEMELLGLNGSVLAGQDVAGGLFVSEKGEHFLRISHLLKNRGDSSSGRLFVKLYTRESIPLGNVSTDEPRYKYETYIAPAHLDPNELPGKFASQLYYTFFLPGTPGLKEGRHPALLKVYFGKGRVAQADITIVVQRGGK